MFVRQEHVTGNVQFLKHTTANFMQHQSDPYIVTHTTTAKNLQTPIC